MHISQALYVLLAALAAGGASQTQPAATMTSTATRPDHTEQDLKARVDKAIEPLRKAGKFAQVVGILIDGQEHIFAYGTLAAHSSQPVNGDTLFEIGSCTKTFTALALASMAQDKLIKYDDPVRLYVPADWRVPTRGGKEITLEHLATHTAGLPRVPQEVVAATLVGSDPYRNYTPALLGEFLGEYKLRRDIGSKWEYSNLGLGLLGYALSRKAGVSYEQLIVERICKPLGMGDTCITLSEEQQRRFAQGYSEEGEPTAPWRFDVLAGCGALHSSAKDLLRYTAAQLGRATAPLDAAIRDSHTVRVNKLPIPDHAQTLSWLALSTGEGRSPIYWFSGATGGFEVFIGFRKDPPIGVVVLGNRLDLATQPGTVAGLRLLRQLSEPQTATAPATSTGMER